MTKTFIICGLCFFMFTPKTISQVTTNKYEVEFDQLLAERNPGYYGDLKTILTEFSKNLIAKNIITDTIFQSYVDLLVRISEDDNLELGLNYNLKDSLERLGDGLNRVHPLIESSVIAQKYLNIHHSKGVLFSQKISEMAQNDKELNRAAYAALIMEVYDESDFELPLVKLKIFRFLNPHPNDVNYIYVGKPDPE